MSCKVGQNCYIFKISAKSIRFHHVYKYMGSNLCCQLQCSSSFAIWAHNSLHTVKCSTLQHTNWRKIQNSFLLNSVFICLEQNNFWPGKWLLFEYSRGWQGSLTDTSHTVHWLHSPCHSASPPSYLSSLQSTGSAVQCWTTAVKSCLSRPPSRSASLCPPRPPSHLWSLAAAGPLLDNDREGGRKVMRLSDRGATETSQRDAALVWKYKQKIDAHTNTQIR